MHLAVSMDDRVEIKEREKIDKHLDLARELKKAIKHESYGYITSCCWLP